jgi:hypothetical protein
LEHYLNDFEEIEIEETLTDAQIFTEIWYSPHRVFRFLINNYHDKYLYVLLFLGGISSSFDQAIRKNQGDSHSTIYIIGYSVILGGCFGWIGTYMYSALISWTGKLLNGEAGTQKVMFTLAHALIPNIAGLLFLFLSILLFGNETFKSETQFSGFDGSEIIG